MRDAGVGLVAWIVALMAWFGAAPAWSSCGAEGCVLDSRGPESNLGRFSFEVAYQFVDQDQVRVGDRRGTVGEIPADHNEIETKTKSWIVTGRAHVNDLLAFSATLPYHDRLHRHQHEHHPGYWVEQSWSYSGLGDLTMLGYYSPWGSRGRTAVTMQLGVKAPTGLRNVPLSEDGDQPEPMARPGTGSVDGLAGLQVRRSFDLPTLRGEAAPASFSLGVLGRLNNKGTDDYRVGNELQLNAAGGWAPISNVQLLTQVNVRWRAKDKAGATQETEENTGGTAIIASPGLRVGVGPALVAFGYVQFRVFERVNGIQTTAPSHLMVGTSYGF